MFYQLVEGVEYLHKNNIIHRDIKPENILLQENKAYPTVKIADFGMAKLSEIGTTACGTIQYAAPEVLMKSRYNHKRCVEKRKTIEFFCVM